MKELRFLNGLIALLTAVSLISLFSLKGLIPVVLWSVSPVEAEIYYTIASGVFGGCIVFGLTSALPSYVKNSRRRKDVKEKLLRFAKDAREKIEDMDVPIHDSTKEDVSELFRTTRTYGWNPKGTKKDNIYERLHSLKTKNDRLQAFGLRHYDFLFGDPLMDYLKEIDTQRLFGSESLYLNKSEEELCDEPVNLGKSIHAFYTTILKIQEELEK